MQTIEVYSRLTLDKVFKYFGKSAERYKYKDLQNLRMTYEDADNMFDKDTDINKLTLSRYEYLKSYFKEEIFMEVINLTLTSYLYPDFYHMLKDLTGQNTTFHLALLINDMSDKWNVAQLKGGFELLKRILCVEKKNENFLYSELFADERLVLFLSGDDYVTDDIKEFTEIYFPWEDENIYYNIEASVTKVQNVFSKINSTRGYIFWLSGNEGIGKRSILKELARKEETGWLFVDTEKLLAKKKETYEKLIWMIHREAIMYDIGICFYHYKPEKNGENIETFLKMINGQYEKLIYPITICTDEKVEIMPFVNLPVYRMAIPKCSRNERIEIWNGFAKENSLAVNSKKYAIQYSLNPGDIKKIFTNLKLELDETWSEDRKDDFIADLCMEMRAKPGKGSVHRIESGYVMEDLKLEAKEKKYLEHICAYIQKSHLVYDEWKMETKFAYGKGITALFYGPPGTGKTMAAYVLSNEIKLPLYRVDLSQVVDKYIGETEKRLDEIFDYAEKSNVILFFDEADSIFSKRTEVKDSKDKYANTEVSFILQRIEEYDGMVILATNYRNNIDEAFMRRMKYVVEFKMPDYMTRLEIWKNSFSKEIPLEEIDYEYLAEKIQLSGGYIKNIIINAVFQAAEEGTSVSMKHIINSVRNEYAKLGKVMTTQDLEKYAYYFTK